MSAKHSFLIAIGCLLAASLHAQSDDKPQIATQIESMRLQVQNDGEKAYFHFSEDVVLNATNMRVNCDNLEVFANREYEAQSSIGKFSAIQQIIATGNVKIVQEERTAYCDKAVVQPNEERIVLTGNPARVEQTGGIITSDEIVLNRADGRITFDGSAGRRIRLTGPAIGDLGFEQKNPMPLPADPDAENAGDTAEQDDTSSETTSEDESGNAETNTETESE